MYKDNGFSFPLKLKMLRLNAGKSQQELADDLGISRSCLANYETGKRQPDTSMIRKISEMFEVMSDYLIGRPGYRHLRLNEEEINRSKKLKELIQNRGNTLDLSKLAVEHKIGLIEFYDYMLSRQKQSDKNA
ncbi:MAG: helix-turn-helix transcriptional regulator [Ruminococcaceae bacterium]|nr:helix-turn-helix transcriptional regulator [Oscillospiraceae bacterium]